MQLYDVLIGVSHDNKATDTVILITLAVGKNIQLNQYYYQCITDITTNIITDIINPD